MLQVVCNAVLWSLHIYKRRYEEILLLQSLTFVYKISNNNSNNNNNNNNILESWMLEIFWNKNQFHRSFKKNCTFSNFIFTNIPPPITWNIRILENSSLKNLIYSLHGLSKFPQHPWTFEFSKNPLITLDPSKFSWMPFDLTLTISYNP